MNSHGWLIASLILFIIAGVLAIVQPPTAATAPRRWLQAFTVQCAGLACLTAAFLVAK